jgi:hypothetical protein
MNESGDQLDKIALRQLTWKPGIVRNLAIEIVENVLVAPHRVWPDDIRLDKVNVTDRNTIGIAWRMLAKADIIKQTGQYRKSTAANRNAGTVFEYALKSRARAETFLKRNSSTVHPTDQPELFVPAYRFN